jgi:hypothetical protein
MIAESAPQHALGRHMVLQRPCLVYSQCLARFVYLLQLLLSSTLPTKSLLPLEGEQ